jgi:hypothetical protein
MQGEGDCPTRRPVRRLQALRRQRGDYAPGSSTRGTTTHVRRPSHLSHPMLRFPTRAEVSSKLTRHIALTGGRFDGCWPGGLGPGIQRSGPGGKEECEQPMTFSCRFRSDGA